MSQTSKSLHTQSRNSPSHTHPQTPTEADYYLWAITTKLLLRRCEVPILHWDNYHSWAPRMKDALSRANLLCHITPSPVSATNSTTQLGKALAASIIRQTLSPHMFSLLRTEVLNDGARLWEALEEELVPKGVATYILTSVALSEGQHSDEMAEGWEFRRRKLEEEREYCGVESSDDLDFVVGLMVEGVLGEEFDGLKEVWLGMKEEELRKENVVWMVEGWVLEGVREKEG